MVALALSPAPALAGICHSKNLMPAFFAFEARTRNLPPKLRADRFAKEFAAAYPEFYEDKDVDWPAQIPENALRLLDPVRPEAMAGFPAFSQARFQAVADTIGRDFDAAQAKFITTFPDFTCEAEIEFGPSFLRFDGHAKTDASGRFHMLFGVDAMALEHGPEDMPIVFAHELFHIYHRQLMGTRALALGNVTWWAMWEEGLATYVSQRLNPGSDAQQVLSFPKDMVRRMQRPGATPRAAKLLLAGLDTSNGRLFDTARSVSGLPPRAGYYMGYLLARDLGRNQDLHWLAHLPPDQVKHHAREFLAMQAKAR